MSVTRAAAAVLVVASLAPCWLAPAATASPRDRDKGSGGDPSRYVEAGAAAGGDGSRERPFSSLARIQRASRVGDRIVVLPVRRSLAPLDGGIALKPRQRLVGAGPPIGSRKARRAASRITNTGPRHAGDAVVLDDRTTVANLEIVGARRGGIYGENVSGVRIRGNDISGHNISCTRGFHIPPFNVPTTVPGVGIPISEGLHNGWAGIMVDADQGHGVLTISDNRVHDSACGDGIDVRAFDRARMHALVSDNSVHDLRQGDGLESVLAFGLQTSDRAHLTARLLRNRQTDLGNPEDLGAGPTGADSEGVFLNPTGASRMHVTVARNRYTNPQHLGGFSANGLEFVTMGDGTRAEVGVRDSTFSGSPGDVLEQLALGTNARLGLELVEVTATRSSGFAESGYGNTVAIPGNNADCLLSASGGAGNEIELDLRYADLTGCANNGLTFGSAVANGMGPTTALDLDARDSRITGNGAANIRIGNVAELDRLSVRVERTDLSDSGGVGSGSADVAVEDLGRTTDAVVDFGGGRLGSAGRNCIEGGLLAADVIRYPVSARGNWWGRPGGPGPGRTAVVGGALDTGSAFMSQPRACDDD